MLYHIKQEKQTKIYLLMYSHIHILITKKNVIIKSTTILYSSH